MKLKTVKDIPEIKGKKILLRVDFNVPLDDDLNITDDTRITEALPTIKELNEKGAKLIIMSHLGRPKGEIVEKLRLTPITKHLEKLLEKTVLKIDDINSDKIKEMNDGDIIMLENIRFHKEEKECEENFCKELASLGEIFVNDAFGTAHRKHASTAGLAEHLPAYAGLLMEKEINALSPIINEEPIRPLTMIFGGAKIDTKIGVINNFLDKADYFLIGGALANTFLVAAGYNVADSLYEEDKVELAREIMMEAEKKHRKFILPKDAVVASEVSEEAEKLDIPIQDIEGDMKILDLGKWSAEEFCNIIKESGTIIWNGPLGLTEFKNFQKGTKIIADCLAEHNCNSIIGGGDTADAIKRFQIDKEKFTHISTGGGACIEFLSGKELPGIKALVS